MYQIESFKENAIILVNKDGSKEEAEVLFIIDLDDKEGERKFLLYSKNEAVENGNVSLYLSEVVSLDQGPVLKDVDDDTFVRCLEQAEKETGIDFSEVFDMNNVERSNEKSNDDFWEKAFSKITEHGK